MQSFPGARNTIYSMKHEECEHMEYDKLGIIEWDHRHSIFLNIIQSVMGADMDEATILDVGCGFGDMTRGLSSMVKKIHGIDARKRNIEICESRADGIRNVKYKAANALDICSKNHERYDIVLVAGLLYHLSFKENVDLLVNLLKLAKRVLIIDSNFCNTNKTVITQWNGNLYEGRFHVEFPKAIPEEQMEAHLRYRYETEKTRAASWIPTVDSALALIKSLGVKTIFQYAITPDLNPVFYNPNPHNGNNQVWTRLQSSKRCIFAVFPPAQQTTPRSGPFSEASEMQSDFEIEEQSFGYIPKILKELSNIKQRQNALTHIDKLFQAVSPSYYKYVYLGLLECGFPSSLIVRCRIYLEGMARNSNKNDAAFCSFATYCHLHMIDKDLGLDLLHSVLSVLAPCLSSPWLDVLQKLSGGGSQAFDVFEEHRRVLALEYTQLPKTSFPNLFSILPILY